MSAIKPECLCLISGWIHRPEWDGKIVEVVRVLPADWSLDRMGKAVFREIAWQVKAPWLPALAAGRLWAAQPSWLIPLNDPQVDLTADYPLMLEDKLREAA